MELGLSLGDTSKPFGFLQNNSKKQQQQKNGSFNFCMDLGLNTYSVGNQEREEKGQRKNQENDDDDDEDDISQGENSDDNINNQEVEKSPLQLNLLPFVPVARRVSLPWSSDNGSSENGSSGNMGRAAAKELRLPAAAAEEVSSANSVGPTFDLDFGVYRGSAIIGNSNLGKRDFEAMANDVVEAERASSRNSDDDENGINCRKKLRLSKQQSAFLEESFKEHNTLNPKQKLALAKQLNLRPRQVEVWFQNRRARTKLKQTEVDCEYLKRCCETLTEENRRLHKELQELRALKISNRFQIQSPATTLTMCPSCERVATTNAAAPPPSAAPTESGKNGKIDITPRAIQFPINRPRFFPFSQNSGHPNQPAAS